MTQAYLTIFKQVAKSNPFWVNSHNSINSCEMHKGQSFCNICPCSGRNFRREMNIRVGASVGYSCGSRFRVLLKILLEENPTIEIGQIGQSIQEDLQERINDRIRM